MVTPTARSQKAPRILPMSTVGSSINWIPKRDGYTRIQEYLYTNASRAHSTISCLALRRSAIILHHTHALTLTHTHTHSHARTHTHSRTHSHTLTCTLTHTHAHTHTHTAKKRPNMSTQMLKRVGLWETQKNNAPPLTSTPISSPQTEGGEGKRFSMPQTETPVVGGDVKRYSFQPKTVPLGEMVS